MCLHRKDGISNTIRQLGRYPECLKLVREWRSQYGPQPGLFVELGANIGACTLEMLLLTNTTVFAFEPSPVNLFYLTSSLWRAVQQHSELRPRVWVFPFAVGEAPLNTTIYTAVGNGGNGVLQQPVRDWGKKRQKFTTHAIEVRTLDEMIGRRRVDMVQMDIQATSHIREHSHGNLSSMYAVCNPLAGAHSWSLAANAGEMAIARSLSWVARAAAVLKPAGLSALPERPRRLRTRSASRAELTKTILIQSILTQYCPRRASSAELFVGCGDCWRQAKFGSSTLRSRNATLLRRGATAHNCLTCSARTFQYSGGSTQLAPVGLSM